MGRILLLTMLLMVVYSWEDFKQTLRVLLCRVFRKKVVYRHDRVYLDRAVSSLVLFAVFPLGIAHYFASRGGGLAVSGWLGFGLLIVSLAAFISWSFLRRLHPFYGSAGNLVSSGLSLVGLVAPVIGTFAELRILPRLVLAKFAFWLAVPFFFGFAVQKAGSLGWLHEQALPHLDRLIFILIAALLVRVGIDFLERHLRFHAGYGLSLHFRVLLGVVLGTALLFG